jgi:hypothetical protein
MNKRIREITGQVLDELVPETWTALGYDKIKEIQRRTAELILIEVTDILSTYRGKMVFEDGAEYNYEHPIIAIRKHFGVEE